jgi:GntR family transcriptional regulator, transcriptional repressor for pyruvate dehydrogenase complex
VRDTVLDTIFGPVHPPTTFEETVERLGSAIRLGLLSPGTQLPPERELAEQLGISRSTLRQAITALVQSGHLLSLRGRHGGTFVVERPPLASGEALPDDWRDVCDLRLALESGAALLAAERATEAQLARMAEMVDVMADADEFPEYRRADVRFHVAMAEAAGSARLVSAMTEVQAQVGELIAHIAHPATVLEHSNADHRRLIAALAAGDGARAVRIVRRHLQGTEHIVAGLMPPVGPA